MRLAITPSTVSGSPRSVEGRRRARPCTCRRVDADQPASASARASSSTNSGLPPRRGRGSARRRPRPASAAPRRSAARSSASSSLERAELDQLGAGLVEQLRVLRGERAGRAAGEQRHAGQPAADVLAQQRPRGRVQPVRVVERDQQRLGRRLGSAAPAGTAGWPGCAARSAARPSPACPAGRGRGRGSAAGRARRARAASHLALGALGAVVDVQQRREHMPPAVVGRGLLDRVAGAEQAAHARARRRAGRLGQQVRLAQAGLGLDGDRARPRRRRPRSPRAARAARAAAERRGAGPGAPDRAARAGGRR